MKNKIYLKEALLLYEEANDICDKLMDINEDCDACKYYGNLYCKVSCLQENYDIINKKTLQLLFLDDYEDIHNICIMSPCPTHTEFPEMKCSKCFLESLLTDKDVMFIKKGK